MTTMLMNSFCDVPSVASLSLEVRSMQVECDLVADDLRAAERAVVQDARWIARLRSDLSARQQILRRRKGELRRMQQQEEV